MKQVVCQEHPRFEKNQKSAKIHIPQRARIHFQTATFRRELNELNRLSQMLQP